jgi:hypothetical protein
MHVAVSRLLTGRSLRGGVWISQEAADFRGDLIVTPERIICRGSPKRPARLDLDSLSS